MARKFEWDIEKNKVNAMKHSGVGFEDAVTVFDDMFAVKFYEKERTTGANRFIIIGMDTGYNMLVCLCCSDNDTVIRIISARRAVETERKLYKRGVK